MFAAKLVIRMEQYDCCSSPVADRSQVDIGSEIKQNETELPAGFETWAPCKQQSWNQMNANPNAFFYRHVMPGENKKNGPWSNDEKLKFIKALEEEGGDVSHWGLFARKICGRVGYQCNAFFKKLQSSGELTELLPGIKFSPPKINDETKPSTPKRSKKYESDSDSSLSCDQYSVDFPPESETSSFTLKHVSINEFRQQVCMKLRDLSTKEKFICNAKLYY